jgi:hypothetical protein
MNVVTCSWRDVTFCGGIKPRCSARTRRGLYREMSSTCVTANTHGGRVCAARSRRSGPLCTGVHPLYFE